jgi:hypothetical protein
MAAEMRQHIVLLTASIFAAAIWAGCGSTTSNTDVTGDPDAGSGDDTSDAGDEGEAGAITPVCTSKTTWKNGDRGSASMHPGRTCVSCHDANGGPPFWVGGTVYPTAHEPDDCNGVDGTVSSMTVVITDANNKVFTLPVNSVGNFYSRDSTIKMPFHAKVVANGKERAMQAAQSTGDCDTCHTVNGAKSAPGRIMAP